MILCSERNGTVFLSLHGQRVHSNILAKKNHQGKNRQGWLLGGVTSKYFFQKTQFCSYHQIASVSFYGAATKQSSMKNRISENLSLDRVSSR